ncbi:Crp/Fnr family transcriptional regulator [Alicyclobacillus sp. SO9]|uniref:Crp/Fnr family transcriptional regulator n=1 Tax=Alicyclobacillus sp. SO9 TaxID=2665646 RepID=UPI0018E8E4F0|nr:Crp/Fnr family transcriptional regulator [Alicyclobacillus sp. SO9]QQE79219.1 Crp/Fnr family transcriptional regulator [Alicyclobacillus sp. SO9]
MPDRESILSPKDHFPFLEDAQTRADPNWNAAFPKGRLLLVTGDICESVVLVLRGQIRVYQVSNSGRELTLYRVGPGESCVLMLSSVLAEQSYPAVAAAETDVTAVTVPVAMFREWMQKSTGVQRFVYDTLYHRLTNVMVLVHEVTFGKMDVRIACYLLEHTSAENIELTVRHEDIALELGTAREVVTRILHTLERDSLIATGKGRITVTNRSALAKRCEDA